MGKEEGGTAEDASGEKATGGLTRVLPGALAGLQVERGARMAYESTPPGAIDPGIGILATPTPALGLLAVNPLPTPAPKLALGESPPLDLLGERAGLAASPAGVDAPGMAMPAEGWATLKLLLGERADPVGGEEAEEEAWWWWCAY